MFTGNECRQNCRHIGGFTFLLFALLISGCLGTGKLPQTSITRVATILPSKTGTKLPSNTVTPTFTISPSSTPQYQRYVVNEKSLDVWDDPENENKYLHLLTQLVLGEKVLLLGTQNEWSEIAAVEQLNKSNPLGYSGWVRSEDLVYGWPTSQEFIVVMKPAAYIYTQPDGFPKMSVYLDTRLVMVSSSSGWVQVALPDGEDGWMRIADVRISSNLDESIPTDGLISLAKTFIGASYRWGGTTAAGIDCSGLIYRVFHAYGITLFRDADDLATEGEAVSRNDLEMGDLIFTASKPGGPVVHVAMYLGGEYILDATEYYGVYMRSIQEFLYDNPWVNAQRFIP